MNVKEQWFFGEEPIRISSPEESLWQAVLRQYICKATHVEFTIGSRQKTPQKFAPFDSFLEKKFVSSWKYGARVPLRGKILYLRYILAPPLIKFIQKVPTLYAWMDDLPEDPSLYFHSRLLVWSISHEGYIYVKLTQNERSELQTQGFRLEECLDSPEWLYPLENA